LHGSIDAAGGLQPFVREILLIECHVAGTSHRDLSEAEPKLEPGNLLILKREPKNPYDARAIQIFDVDGRILGYVPRAKNEALSNLMDAGKFLFGKMDAVERRGDWLKIDVRVFLRDV
jgi:hypothetical protein